MNRSLLLITLLCFMYLLPRTANAQIAGPAGVNSGIVLWLDGSNVNNTAPATNPANGTGISTWKDVSGNGNDATVLSGQNTPALSSAQINGHDVINFTRSTNLLGCVYSVAGVDMRSTTLPQVTILTVYRQGSNVVTDWQGLWGNDNGGWDRFFMPHFGSNNGIVSVGPPTNNVTVTNAGVVGATKLLTAVYDHGVTNGSTIYFNGLPVQSVTDNTDPTAAQTTLRIGWDGDDNPFNGDIAEMVVYNRKLTDCEIQAINRYFGLKFGVTITTASITPAPKAYFCPASSTTLTSSTGLTYQWLLNGTSIPTATSSTYSASAYGKYQVVVGNGVCLDTSAATTVYSATPIIYVDSSVASSGSGQSWASPLKTVAEALDIANNTTCNMQIWVKKGTYYPMADNVVATSRDSSLRILRNNVKLYGGFAGTEVSLTGRNISANPTILSGDIGVANDSSDNSYHIMTIVGNSANNIDSNTVVDGFTIRDGKAENSGTFTVTGMIVYRGAGGGINLAGNVAGGKSSPLLENLSFIHNFSTWGGGIYGQGHTSGIVSPVVRNCSFTNNDATAQGGAINFYTEMTGGESSPSIINCIFTNNHANANGGAVHTNAASPATSNALILNCTFTGNKTDLISSGSIFGGGIVAYGAAAVSTVKHCTFTNNASSYGGGICTAGPLLSMILDSNTFTGNTAINSGGGVTFQGATLTCTNNTFTANKGATGGAIGALGNTSLTVSNCTMINDSVTFYGGAIYNGTALTTTLTNNRFINNYGAIVGAIDNPGGGIINLTKCVFSGNKSGELGGVMNNYAGTSNFINCVLENNSTTTTANLGGGAIHIQGGSTVNFYNSTLNNNTTASTTLPGANALSLDATGTLNLSNTIIWGTAATQIAGGGTPTYNYSLVRGAAITAPNLTTNPSFVDVTDPDGADNIWGTSDDGLNLTQCSPAITAGSNALIPGTLTTDFTASTRIQNTTVDMGAYETPYVYNIPLIAGSSFTNPTNCGVSDGTISLTGLKASTNYTVDYSLGGVPQTSMPVTTNASGTAVMTALAPGSYTNITVTLTSLGCLSSNSVAGPILLVSPVAPSVTAQPVNSTICEGANTSFAVTGAGSALTYQWQLNTGSGFSNISNGGVYSGATSATLSITGGTAAMNNYAYRAVVSGTCTPADTSNSAVLTVNLLPTITTQPSNTPVCDGSNTSFTIAATGTALTYQWQVDNGGGYTNLTNTAPYNNVTTATLTITGATTALNSYKYRVIVSGTCAPSVTSTDAILTVNTAPVINAQPSPSIICKGSNTTFTVGATGTALTYQWQVDNGSGFANLTNSAPYSNVTTATMTITNASTAITGYQYRVIVSGTCTPNVTSSAVALTVNALPAITTSPVNTSVCVTSNTSLSVVATGAGITYQWQVDNGSGFTNVTNTGVYSGATTSTLSITGATYAMTGLRYRVLVSGTCTPAVASNTATLTVNLPPFIVSQSGDITICEKDNATLKVIVAGVGLTYQWQVDNGTGFTNLTNTAPYSGVTSANLVITNAPTSISGYKYRVVIGSTCLPGTNSVPVIVNVNLLPKITSQSTNSNVCPGSPIVLSVTAVGAIGYQWQMNTGTGFVPVPNIPMYSGTTSPTLTINTPTYAMTGYQYRVVVTGICAPPATSTVIKLNVYNIRITSQMYSDTACEGWTTQMGIRAAGGGLYYQWQKKTATGYVDVLNVPPYSGANTDSLRITEAPGELDGSIYRCKAKETVLCNLTFYSEDISLIINHAPQIAPTSLNVTAFGSATFSVPNSGSSFQWQEDRNDGAGFTDLTDNAPYSGTTTNTLAVNPVNLEMNSFKYRCVVRGLCFNPMTSKSSIMTVAPALSIKTTIQSGMNNVVIYPNPLSGSELNISFDKVVKGITNIVVLDKLGQVVYKTSLDFSQNKKGSISLNGIAAGVYTIHFVNENGETNAISRFTKQ